MGLGNSRVHDINVLFHGGLSSGKKAIIERISGRNVTIDYNVSYCQDYEYKGHNFHLWALKGDKTGRLWRQYTKNLQVLVFVIDGTQPKILLELKRDLEDALRIEDLKETFILFYVNKIDEGGAFNSEQAREVLELDKIRTHKWAIFNCSAATGYGIFEGMDWIVDQIES